MTTYDGLDNLVRASQGAQTRTWRYASLGRLRRAENPESGVTAYEFDAHGNLTNRQDARRVSTAFGYDSLV